VSGTISPDGKWMWNGTEWIPAPPSHEPNPSVYSMQYNNQAYPAQTQSSTTSQQSSQPRPIFIHGQPDMLAPMTIGGDLNRWNMTITQQLFGFRGRINRQRYWIYSILLSIISVIFALLLGFVAAPVLNTDFSIGLAATIIGAPFNYMIAALSVKRLRDSNRGDGWIIAFAMYLLLIILSNFAPLGSNLEESLTGFACCFGFLPGLFMAFEPGTKGPNKYGPDPLQ
jgi:uncharacterized membrane protein YhaH (DUF805 family)